MAKRDYTKDGRLTVHWDSKLCFKSGICVRTLPGVFRPGDRPWIHVEEADVDSLAAAVDLCPSRALSYTWLDEEAEQRYEERTRSDSAAETDENQDTGLFAVPGPGTCAPVSVRPTKNGPYEVTGLTDIVADSGEPMQTTRKTWLCRCGHSANKPFCDGSHERVGFRDPGTGPQD